MKYWLWTIALILGTIYLISGDANTTSEIRYCDGGTYSGSITISSSFSNDDFFFDCEVK